MVMLLQVIVVILVASLPFYQTATALSDSDLQTTIKTYSLMADACKKKYLATLYPSSALNNDVMDSVITFSEKRIVGLETKYWRDGVIDPPTGKSIAGKLTLVKLEFAKNYHALLSAIVLSKLGLFLKLGATSYHLSTIQPKLSFMRDFTTRHAALSRRFAVAIAALQDEQGGELLEFQKLRKRIEKQKTIDPGIKKLRDLVAQVDKHVEDEKNIDFSINENPVYDRIQGLRREAVSINSLLTDPRLSVSNLERVSDLQAMAYSHKMMQKLWTHILWLFVNIKPGELSSLELVGPVESVGPVTYQLYWSFSASFAQELDGIASHWKDQQDYEDAIAKFTSNDDSIDNELQVKEFEALVEKFRTEVKQNAALDDNEPMDLRGVLEPIYESQTLDLLISREESLISRGMELARQADGRELIMDGGVSAGSTGIADGRPLSLGQ